MFKKIQLFALCAIPCLGFAQEPKDEATKSTSSKPNILFIMMDDLGKEWISCYGSKSIETPHIDALAKGGMKFNNAYSMPKCTPSRVALLTGKYPWRNGFVNHWDVPRWGIGYFDWKKKRNTTFAKLMKGLGYSTFATGKWQLNDFRIEPLAMQKHGFDDWSMWTGYESGNKKSTYRYKNPYINTPAGSKTHDGKFGPDVYTDDLINFMTKHKDEPMCLYYPMALPHTPMVSTPDEPNAKSKIDQQKAMVRYSDKMVGKLVKALDNLGIRKQTIIIVTTDNGSTKGIIGNLNGVKVSGAKSQKIEAGICEPFIVNCPGLVPAGVETEALTDFTDLLPTFVDLGGGKIAEDLIVDGVSFAPLILGKEKDTSRKWIMALGGDVAICDDKGLRGIEEFAERVIRDKQFKVWVSTGAKITRLHDLKKDPWEKKNLIDSEAVEHKTALKKFQAVIDTLPKKDARPVYEPRAANPWDNKDPKKDKVKKGKKGKREKKGKNK